MGWNSLRTKKHVVCTEKHDKRTKRFSYVAIYKGNAPSFDAIQRKTAFAQDFGLHIGLRTYF